MATKVKAADLFCGAGGTSIGAHDTDGVEVRFAVNHWDVAIKTHSANFPNAKHVQTELRWVKPGESDPINLLFASPECTHHSRARGGRPTTDQQRAGAWEILPWIEYHRPSFVVIENVAEFQEWGPVCNRANKPLSSLRGRFFEAWIAAIKSAGYRVDFRRLNAADFGAATSRERLFIVAKKGRRSFHWPEPTHSRSSDRRLPGMELERWRGAIEIIDWSIPLPSVFSRRRPLADKTLARIRKGLERHVAPFVVQLRNNMVGRDITSPLGTMTAGGGHHGISVPFIATINHGDDGSNGSRTKDIRNPLGTLTTSNGRAVVAPFIMSAGGREVDARSSRGPLPTLLTHQNLGIAAPFFVPRHGERDGQAPRSHSSDDPLPVIATSNAPSLAIPLVMAPQGGAVARPCSDPVPVITTMAGSQLIVPWLTSFYGSQNSSDVGAPVPTITTVDRHAATAALIGGSLPTPRTDAERELQETMATLGVADIGFRMLSNEELANAQGFPMSYQFCGTKKDVTKQIGNSVSPPVAKAITEALLS